MRDLKTSKTFADMTAEERAECVGMWADAMGQGLGVIVNATELSDCWVLFPEDGGSVATCRNQRVTPRFDLPRAWTPDGEPSEETWEYGVEYKYLTNRGTEWRLDPSAGWHKAYRAAERAARTSVQFRIVRRRVSPVEVINE